MNKSIFIIGAGGHASVLLDTLKKLKIEVTGYISPKKPLNNSLFSGLLHLLSDDDIDTFNKDEVLLVNGIGALPQKSLREDIFIGYKDKGFRFLTVVDPSAIVSSDVRFDEGAQVLPGAIINAGVTIGLNTIINSGAIIEHDCSIGPNNHIAPGAVLCGGVSTQNNVFIGAGAVIIQTLVLNKGTLIASGAVVNKNTAENMTVYSPQSVFKQR